MSANVARSPYRRKIATSLAIILGTLAPAYALAEGSDLTTCESPTTLSKEYDLPVDEGVAIERGTHATMSEMPHGPGAYVVYSLVVRSPDGEVVQRRESDPVSPKNAISALLGVRAQAPEGSTAQFGVRVGAVEGSQFCDQPPTVDFDNSLLATAYAFGKLADVVWRPIA